MRWIHIDWLCFLSCHKILCALVFSIGPINWMNVQFHSKRDTFLSAITGQPASQPAIVVVWQSHVRHRCVARVARESKKRKKHQNDCLHKYSRRFVKVKTDFFFVYGSEKKAAFLNGNFCERIQIKRWKQWWCWFFFVLFYLIVLQVANVCYFQAMDVSAYLEMKR